MDQVIEGVIKLMQLIFFFPCGPFLKSLLNLLQYCFCFMLCVCVCVFKSFFFFACKACRILAPRPRIESVATLLEGEVLTTGPPGKSHATDS